VNVVVFSVGFNEIGFEVPTDLLENDSKALDGIAIKDLFAVLGDEDQMDMNLKDAMPAMSDVT
jgi:hypothetical protein